MVRAWWEGTGGRICEEYPLTPTIPGRQARRRVDALVVLNQPSAWVDDCRDFGPTDGEDLIVVQAKASRLAMPLLGQAIFSPILARSNLHPASVRSVLLCTGSDDDLAPIAAEHGVEVIVSLRSDTPGRGGSRPTGQHWSLGPSRWAER